MTATAQKIVFAGNGPTQEQRITWILGKMIAAAAGSENEEEVIFLTDYVSLLRRQAAKAGNRKRALAELHTHHKAVIMENRWLRSTLSEASGGTAPGARFLDSIIMQAKGTLWSVFRRQYKSEVKDTLEWLTNICCGMSKAGGGVSEEEKTAAIKTAQKILGKE